MRTHTRTHTRTHRSKYRSKHTDTHTHARTCTRTHRHSLGQTVLASSRPGHHQRHKVHLRMIKSERLPATCWEELRMAMVAVVLPVIITAG